MMLRAAWVLSGVLLLAPLQCSRTRDAELRHEDGPGDALWDYAAWLKEHGRAAESKDVLRFLVRTYPSSRRAYAAKEELAASSATSEGPDGGAARPHDVAPR